MLREISGSSAASASTLQASLDILTTFGSSTRTWAQTANGRGWVAARSLPFPPVPIISEASMECTELSEAQIRQTSREVAMVGMHGRIYPEISGSLAVAVLTQRAPPTCI